MSTSIRPSHLAFAISSALATSGLQAAIITVDTLADPGGPGECSLRHAVDSINDQTALYGCAAPDGVDDSIVFSGGLSGTITLTYGQIDINEAMSINGPGVENITIDADGASRIFQVSSTTAAISDLTMTGGGSVSYGGAVYIVGNADVTLSDCVITGNTADSYGGAIEVFSDSYLLVDSCQITNNDANYGGGVAVTAAQAVVRNSLVSGNTATDLGGGLRVTGQYFGYGGREGFTPRRASHGQGRGVGYYNSASLIVQESLVTGNSADVGGGIGAGNVYYYGGLASSSASLLERLSDAKLRGTDRNAEERGFPAPYAPNLVVVDSTISDNIAFAGGGIGAVGNRSDIRGGVYGGTTNEVYLVDTVVSGNLAMEGGGIAAKYSTTYVVDSTVDNNAAYAGGGILSAGIYSGAVPYAIGSPVAWSDGDSSRGGIGNGQGVLLVANSTVSGNILIPPDNGLAERGGGTYVQPGGGIVNALGIAYLIGSQVNNNNSPDMGGGIFTALGGTVSFRSQINDNHGGGSLAIEDSVFLMAESRMEGNHGGAVGGLACESNSVCVTTYSSVTGNQGTIAGGLGVDVGSHYGGVLGRDWSERGIQPKYAFVYSSTFSGNSGGYFGGIGAPELMLHHSTIAFNEQSDQLLPFGSQRGGFPAAGGIGTTSYTELSHSLVSENISSTGTAELNAGGGAITMYYSLIGDDNGEGFVAYGTGNIFNQDPLLGPLGFNGSVFSQTHALLEGSPAIDAGDPAISNPPDYDQRGSGFDRIYDSTIDIGAFEFQGAIPEPAIALSATEMDFGNVLVGTSDFAQLTISSTGDATLVIDQLEIDVIMMRGLQPPFTLINDNCSGQAIPPSEFCTVDVVFEPPARDLFDATLSIPTNTQSSPDMVDLSGRGVAPELSINPVGVDFGAVLVGATDFGSVDLTNVGDAPLEITATSVAAPFGVFDDPGFCFESMPVVLQPGEFCELVFSFTPPSADPFSQDVEIFSDSQGGDGNVFLEGMGDQDAPPPPPPPGQAEPLPVPVLNKLALGILGGGLFLLGWLGLRRRPI